MGIYCSALVLFYCQYLCYPYGKRIPSVKTKEFSSGGSVLWYPGIHLIYMCSDTQHPFRQLSHLVCFMLETSSHEPGCVAVQSIWWRGKCFTQISLLFEKLWQASDVPQWAGWSRGRWTTCSVPGELWNSKCCYMRLDSVFGAFNVSIETWWCYWQSSVSAHGAAQGIKAS